jgi:S1-C subfamily serine protease
MRKSLIFTVGVLGLLHSAMAQEAPPFVSPAEEKAVDQQNGEFNRALTPSLAEAAKSTVRVWSGSRRLAYGTVVEDGTWILTKWSEVARGAGRGLRVESASGDVKAATLTGVYADEDLAILQISDEALAPVKWSDATPGLGTFLAAVQPGGESAGFGVVSVLERNLRDQDQAYLGVIGTIKYQGPGVRIQEVTPGSGAAAAGLRPGMVILKVGDRPISGVLELRNSLTGVNPGAKAMLVVNDGNGDKTVEVLLGSRPSLPKFPGDRLRQMEQMGTSISRVRDSFGRVIQTDMRLQPDQVGGPVVDLKGRVIGVTIARASRTHSYVIPAEEILKLLKEKPEDPALVAQTRHRELAPAHPGRQTAPRQQGRARPANPERIQRHMEEMQQLLDFMREEMENIEENR